MASEIHMPEPICLVENTQGKGLVVQQEVLQVLSEITQPAVVVAITGLYRSGKSDLLNRLAGRRTDFALGSSVQAHIKGIWVWCVPHPCQPGHALVLLDTEGLGDVEKGDTKNDTWIFVLAVLLSSTLIYNSKGTIDQQAMDNLHYVMKLTEYIKVKTAPGESGDERSDSERFVLFFPTLVWAVQDFTLQLQADGKELSEDEYLENVLKPKAGSSQEALRYNQLRECIRQFFPERKCFVFDQPASKRDLPRLEELPDDRIDSEFQQQVEKFCSHIWQKSPPKPILGGHRITGNMLGMLAVTYVEAIQSGAVPCLESAVLALAEIENSATVKKAVTLYQEQMEQRAKLPTETAQELLELHAQCEQEALRVFMARVFEDDRDRFQAELMRQVEAVKEQFCNHNEQASHDKCTAALQELSQDTERRISDGVYLVSGGYQLFQEEQQALVEKYQELPGKGVKADAVLQEFLQRREAVAKSILNTDRALAEKDEQLKYWQAQCERAEQEREAERKREAEKLQKLQDQLRSSEEHVLRLRKQLGEQEKMNKHQSKEQKAHFRDDFHEQDNSKPQQEYSNTSNWSRFWLAAILAPPLLLGLVFVTFML